MPIDLTLPQGDLLVAPEQAAWVEATMTRLADPSFVQAITQKGNETAFLDDEDEADFWDERMSWARPYKVKNGVLTIPVRGVLLNNFPYSFGGWATGYEYIEAAVRRGVDDTEVNEVLLHVDSPGGLVAGCFDCADRIYEARGTKPIRAVADESAYSAAYALASSADDITVARTGGVGSIGVMCAHIEMSEALEQRGIKVTLIYAGERKVDGHPTKPLSKEAQAKMQERTDALYGMFVSLVARNRGLDEATVRGTEADIFMAPQAIEIGLADATGGLDSMSASADSQQDEEPEMSKDNSAAPEAATTQALEAARTEGFEAGKAEGMTAGQTAERERVSTIMDSEEAKTRPVAARQVALSSDMSAEAAAKFLAGLPAEAPATGKTASGEQEQGSRESGNGGNGFDDVMQRSGNPDLGASTEGDGEEMSVSDKIFASAGLGKARA